MTVWLDIAGRRRRIDLPEQISCSDASETGSFLVDGVSFEADFRMVVPGILSMIVGGRQCRFVSDGDAVLVEGKRFPFSVFDPRSLRAQAGTAAASDGPQALKAPMAGRVVRVLVSVGDEVKLNDGLIVIEAMKMQNELKSPRQGRVKRIAADVGQAVAAGELLAVVE